MIVLTRKVNEGIVIGENVNVTIIDIRGDRVRLGVENPKGVALLERPKAEYHDLSSARGDYRQ